MLIQWSEGDREALDRLTPIFYEEVHRITDVEELASFDPQRSRIVARKFFGGLSIEETAEVIGVSPATVKREWALAKAWLFRELS